MNTIQRSENKKISYWLEKLNGFEKKIPNQSPENKGTNETQTVISKQKNIQESKMGNLIKKSNRILATISSQRLPFDFFPDSINIEESRVTIISRNFFYATQVHSVDIKDISNIFINLSFLYAQLIIVSRTFSRNNIEVDFLPKTQAVQIRRIIEGLRVFENNMIDTSNYSKNDLLTALNQLSTTKIVT